MLHGVIECKALNHNLTAPLSSTVTLEMNCEFFGSCYYSEIAIKVLLIFSMNVYKCLHSFRMQIYVIFACARMFLSAKIVNVL